MIVIPVLIIYVLLYIIYMGIISSVRHIWSDHLGLRWNRLWAWFFILPPFGIAFGTTLVTVYGIYFVVRVMLETVYEEIGNFFK